MIIPLKKVQKCFFLILLKLQLFAVASADVQITRCNHLYSFLIFTQKNRRTIKNKKKELSTCSNPHHISLRRFHTISYESYDSHSHFKIFQSKISKRDKYQFHKQKYSFVTFNFAPFAYFFFYLASAFCT